MTKEKSAIQVLIANTFAFTVCFAAWMMNGLRIIFLVDSGRQRLMFGEEWAPRLA